MILCYNTRYYDTMNRAADDYRRADDRRRCEDRGPNLFFAFFRVNDMT